MAPRKSSAFEIEIPDEDVHAAVSAFVADSLGFVAGAVHLVDEDGQRIPLDRAIIEIEDVVPNDDVLDCTTDETYD